MFVQRLRALSLLMVLLSACTPKESTEIVPSVVLEHTGDSLPTGDIAVSFEFDPEGSDCPLEIARLDLTNNREATVQLSLSGSAAVVGSPKDAELPAGAMRSLALEYTCAEMASFNDELSLTVREGNAVLGRQRLQVIGAARR